MFIGLNNGSVLSVDRRADNKQNTQLFNLKAQVSCMKSLKDGNQLLASAINGKVSERTKERKKRSYLHLIFFFIIIS